MEDSFVPVLLGGIGCGNWSRKFQESGFLVVGCAETRGEILECATKFTPDAVVMNTDVGYGGDFDSKIDEALVTIAVLKGQHPDLPVLVFTQAENIDLALKAGADWVWVMPEKSSEIPALVWKALNQIKMVEVA